jgi:hypothetical protein
VVEVQVWTNASGIWSAQLIDPNTAAPETLVFTAMGHGAVIAEVRYRLPLTHLRFQDRFCVIDP